MNRQHTRNTRRMSSKALVSAVVLSTLFVSACSSNNGQSNPGGAAEGASGERVTLKIEVFDRGNTPTGMTIQDNYLTRYVQESFGDPNNIDVEFVPVPRSEEIEKLNVLMSSGSNVPDIVFTYDPNTFNRYASQGGLTDVGPLLDEHAPNLKAFLGDDVLEYGEFEGTQFSIPAKRSNTGKYASFIRQDWLDALGMPVPTTTDELYETLKAFKEQDPGQTGGQVIPFGMTIASAQYETMLWSFIEPLSDEERFTLTQQLGSNDYPTLLPGFKEGLAFMNKLYNDGLISKDFGLDEDKKKFYEDISSGKTGFFSEDDVNLYYENGTYDILKANEENANVLPIDVFTNSEGKYVKPKYAPNGMYIMIPKSSQRPVEAMKYLEWMASDDHLFHIQNGVEGENFTMEDGIPVALENPSQEAIDRMFISGDMAIISNGKQLGNEEDNMKARQLQFPTRYQEDVALAQEIANRDTVEMVVTGRPIEAQTKYATTLQDKFNELIVKSTMATPDQFDTVFENMLRDYMTNGGQAILDERTQLYEELKG